MNSLIKIGFGAVIGIFIGFSIPHPENTSVVKTPDPLNQMYSKEYYDFIATDSSKKTVDFIVNKMISEKAIIVNKDGQSYLFKLNKKYKTPAVKETKKAVHS